MNALLAKAEYYIGYFKLTKELDYLTAAASFASDFVKVGGSALNEIVKAIRAAVAELVQDEPVKPIKNYPPAARPYAEAEPTIFGYTYAEIGFKQGAKALQ